jgi:hypothetical protein
VGLRFTNVHGALNECGRYLAGLHAGGRHGALAVRENTMAKTTTKIEKAMGKGEMLAELADRKYFR